MISSPILHDIIKSELDHNAKEIFELCKTIDPVKNSNLFKKDYWQFREARQEQVNNKYRQADVVWYFQGKKNDNYYVIHEIKTGCYSPLDILNKYHIGMAGQIWVWGWHVRNEDAVLEDNHKRKLKLLDIEVLIPLLITDLNTICSEMVL